MQEPDGVEPTVLRAPRGVNKAPDPGPVILHAWDGVCAAPLLAQPATEQPTDEQPAELASESLILTLGMHEAAGLFTSSCMPGTACARGPYRRNPLQFSPQTTSLLS